MKKRWIIFGLYFAMVVSFAAGCRGGSGDTGAGKYKKFITVDVYDEFAN